MNLHRVGGTTDQRSGLRKLPLRGRKVPFTYTSGERKGDSVHQEIGRWGGGLEKSLGENFDCQVKENWRSACCGSADYQYEDKRYCILHFPSEDKEGAFDKTVKSKLN